MKYANVNNGYTGGETNAVEVSRELRSTTTYSIANGSYLYDLHVVSHTI